MTQPITNPATIAALDKIFPRGPGEVLVPKFIEAMAKEPRFVQLFGPWKGVAEDNQRWADYARYDWSFRHLPAISIFEKDTDEKTSDNGWINGTIGVQVFWPASMRRSALARVPKKFWASLISFLRSELAYELLDPMPGFNEATKCPGLNEIGKSALDTKNVEGFVDNELVPVTMGDVKFRIDLRKWDMWLESQDRTKRRPFDKTLAVFEGLSSDQDPDGIAGVVDADVEQVQILVKSDPDVQP